MKIKHGKPFKFFVRGGEIGRYFIGIYNSKTNIVELFWLGKNEFEIITFTKEKIEEGFNEGRFIEIK